MNFVKNLLTDDLQAEMASFNSLPIEIVQAILDFVLPKDLENLANVSRGLLNVSQQHLKIHRERIRSFSVVERFCPECFHGVSRRARTNILQIVFSEPLFLHYIRHIRILPVTTNCPLFLLHCKIDESGKSLGDSVTQVFDSTRRKGVSAAWTDLCILLSDGSRRHPTDDVLLIILMSLLPNLTVVEFGFEWDSLFRWMILNVIRSDLEKLKDPFSALKTIHFSNTNDIWDVKFISLLPALQSTTTTKTSNYSGSPAQPLHITHSRVTHLVLQDATLTSDVLCEFLNGFPCLKSFVYEQRSPWDGKSDASSVCNALLANAGSTLEDVTFFIQFHPDLPYPTSNFCEFPALQELNTEWNILFPPSAFSFSRLAQALPPSIRKLTLRTAQRGNMIDIISNLWEAAATIKASEILPNLEQLIIAVSEEKGCPGNDCSLRMEDLKWESRQLCEAQGIQFDFIDCDED